MEIAYKEKIIREIKADVSNSIDFKKDASDQGMREIITEAVFEKSKTSYYLNISEKQDIIETIFNSMRRFDILQPIIDDKSVTEIMINGPDNIFIEKEGKVTKLNLCFEKREKLEDVIQSIVSKVNRTVNEASPIVDARLQDGSRVSVVLPPVALEGPVMTIRKFSEQPMTIEQLIKFGSISNEAAEFLHRLILAKYNIFICGVPEVGKQLFLMLCQTLSLPMRE